LAQRLKLMRIHLKQETIYTIGTLFINDRYLNVVVEQVDDDTIRIGNQTMTKPFVEKPVDGEDHNIWYTMHR
jgi:hypothetical protein